MLSKQLKWSQIVVKIHQWQQIVHSVANLNTSIENRTAFIYDNSNTKNDIDAIPVRDHLRNILNECESEIKQLDIRSKSLEKENNRIRSDIESLNKEIENLTLQRKALTGLQNTEATINKKARC